MPQSQAAALSIHQEETETDKTKQAQIEQTSESTKISSYKSFYAWPKTSFCLDRYNMDTRFTKLLIHFPFVYEIRF